MAKHQRRRTGRRGVPALALIMALVFSLFALPISRVDAQDLDGIQVQSYVGYSDVGESDWYVVSGDFDYSLKYGLLTGYDNGLFGPFDPITRGQVATVLWRIAGEPQVTSDSFTDVDYSKFYGPAIRWARATGVVSGYGDTNTFGPEHNVTREQFAVMLANYAEHVAGLDVSSDCLALDAIAGSGSVSSWARSAMGWAVDNAVISGDLSSGVAQVNPQGTSQRCMAVKMMSVLHRDILRLGEEGPATGEDEPESIPGIQSFDYNDDAILIDGSDANVNRGEHRATIDSDVAKGIEAGDIVVIDPDDPVNGMAIKVTAVRDQGSSTVVSGSEPEITEVFDELNMKGEKSFTAEDVVLADGVELVDDGIDTLATGDVELGRIKLKVGKGKELVSTEEEKVSLQGELVITIDPKILYDISIRPWSLTTMVGVELDSSMVGNLGISYEGKLLLGKLGEGVTAEIYLVVGADGTISLDWKLPTASAMVGVRNNTPAVDFDADTSESKLESTAGIEGKLGVEAAVKVKLFGMLAGDAGLEAGLGSELTTQHHTGLTCDNLDAWFYLQTFFARETKALKKFEINQVIFDEDNTPLFLTFHFENGTLVDACTWKPEDPNPGNPDEPTNPIPDEPDSPSTDVPKKAEVKTENGLTYAIGDFVSEDGEVYSGSWETYLQEKWAHATELDYQAIGSRIEYGGYVSGEQNAASFGGTMWSCGRGAYVLGYTGNTGSITVPKALGGYDVVYVSIINGEVNVDASRAANVKAVNCQSYTGVINFGDLNALENISLQGCTIPGDFDASQCEAVRDITFYAVQFNGKIAFAVDNLENFGMEMATAVGVFSLANAPKLKEVAVVAVGINELDLDNCKNLESLTIWDTGITELDISGFPNLSYLSCGGNNISDIGSLQEWLAQPGHSGSVSA